MNIDLYVDVDGVLADWVKEMVWAINHDEIYDQTTLNKHPEARSLIRNVYDKDMFFFTRPPVTTFGKRLIDSLKEQEVSFKILTAVGDVHPSFEIAADSKRLWLKGMFGIPAEDVICVPLSEDKMQYANNNFLIDDYRKNIEQWEKAGGMGHQYEDHAFCVEDILFRIDQFKKYGMLKG